MSHFYGTITGSTETVAAKRGSAESGLVTHAASWSGAIKVELKTEGDDDIFIVKMVPWENSGDEQVLCSGKVGNKDSVSLHNNGWTLLAPDKTRLKQEGIS